MDLTEELMAYADGELDALHARAVEARLADRPETRAVVEAQRVLRLNLSQAYAGVIAEPVPKQLADIVSRGCGDPTQGAAILSFSPARAGAQGGRRVTPLVARVGAAALLGAAACLAGVLYLGPQVDEARRGASRSAAPGFAELPASDRLNRSLDVALASAPDGYAPVSIGLTFRSKGGQWCRTFTERQAGAETAGLACRKAGRWRVLASAPASEAGGGDYRTAGGSTPPVVTNAVGALIGADALTRVQERQARDSGWR